MPSAPETEQPGGGSLLRRAAAVRAVLFDLDGTLISTRRLYLEAYRRALEPDVGRLLTDAEIMALEPRSELRLLRAQVGDAAFTACVERFQQHYRELHDTHFGGIYAGIPPMLEALRAAGLPLGVVTGKSRRSWDTTVAHCALGPFDVTVFDDDVAHPKPHPEGLLLAAERLGLPPTALAYVGDALSDTTAALATGALPVAALWARPPADRPAFRTRVERLGAALFLTSPGELVRLLGR